MTQKHELTTYPLYFDAVASGDKTFEGRKNDRGFQKGDLLKLIRHDGFTTRKSTVYGSELFFRVTYVFQGGQFGVEKNWCVLGIQKITKEEYNECQS